MPVALGTSSVLVKGHTSTQTTVRYPARCVGTLWTAGTRAPTGERAERLVELSALIERLDRVIDPSYIAVWLRKPVPALEDDKPLDVIGRGDYRRVAALVSALEESPTT